MLDLSFLLPKPPAAPPTSAAAREEGLSAAYARYLAEQKAASPQGQAMSAADFERYSLGSGWLTGLKDTAQKVVQTCRLMVGIHDYEYYLDHMRSQHPEATPLSREAFYRYCLDARFPGAGNVNKCPC
ncbi:MULTISPECIES: YbdD/YjiX family protein [Chitinibacter]|uniref:YbdD/YjiX family protein n=1 Tax=Chitinibacter TaxID=230666 RepID=UPI000413A82E